MHLGLIRYKYNPYGGAEKVIERMVNQFLVGHGISRITVFTNEWPSENIRLEGLDVVEVKSGGLTRFGRMKKFFSSLTVELKKHPTIDVLQSHERFVGCDIFRTGDGVHQAWLARLGQRNNSIQNLAKSLDPFHRLICENETRLANDSRTFFVANSPLSFNEARDVLGVPLDRLRLIPNGIDSDTWRTMALNAPGKPESRFGLGLDPNLPCVTFIGSGFLRKGVESLIRAVALLSNVQLLVVGYDKKMDHYRRLAEQLLSGRAVFTGPLKSVTQPLAAADIFVLPSLYDSFPNAALEALAFGVPIIVTNDTGLAPYLQVHGGGRVVTQDPGDIANAISGALSSQASLSIEAINLAKMFDHSAIAPKWFDLYRQIAEERAP